MHYNVTQPEVLVMPHLFLPGYGHSCGIWWIPIIPVDSGGIKFGPETSQNDILVDEYSSRMM
jgi:hypothetical protein